MKLELIRDIHVSKEHDMKKGNIYEIINHPEKEGVWVKSHKTGELIKVLRREFKNIRSIKDE